MDGAALDDHRRLVRGLCRPQAWPPPAPAAVEAIETHLSTVLLAGPWALKLKKPLRLDFVDQSTPALRRFYCGEELRLNRRTAAAWYVDVLAITGTADAPRLGGDAAQAFDWALRMRRFEQSSLLDRMARDGVLGADHVDALARVVAQFHDALPASPAAYGDPAQALGFARGNLQALDAVALAPPEIAALREWTESTYEAIAPLLQRRRARGAVREGHGDLHLGNIAWLDGSPVLFDALEFAPALRHVDVLCDAAFTFMDLLGHGVPALAWRWLDRYLELRGDHLGLPLLRWFTVYRALVRAKVAALRAAQAAPGSPAQADALAAAHRRIALARSVAAAPAPLLVLTSGLSGSGKSTLAAALVEALGAVRVRSDVERKRLHGLVPTQRGDAGLYAPAATQRTYARLAEVAAAALDAGVSVIVDAAFLRRAERDTMRALARTHGARCVLVECRAPDAVLRRRLWQRARSNTDPSDAGVDVLDLQLQRREPIDAGEGAGDGCLGMDFDTDLPLQEMQQRAVALARELRGGGG